jgi:plastocyanin
MIRFVRIVPVIAALILAAGGVIACSSSNDDSSSARPTTVAAAPTQSSGGSGGSAAPTTAAGTRVTAVDFSYSPTQLTAQVGQPVTVNFVNNGQAPHTFTITGVADSGSVAAGQSRTVTFTPASAGTLQFFCTIHGASVMSGTITVQ